MLLRMKVLLIEDEPAITRMIERGLRPLGLLREGDALITRVGAETVAWALSDGRYPATPVDADGAPVATARRHLAESPTRPHTSFAPLIARLREHHEVDSDAAWLDRELDAAVRARAVLDVEVAMPDGSSTSDSVLGEATTGSVANSFDDSDTSPDPAGDDSTP